MHDLSFSLQDHDIGHLKILAELWGLDLPAETTIAAVERLTSAMLDAENLSEIIESLPGNARFPLEDLLHQNGSAAYADMARRYGTIREMGAGRRDRQKPWRDPVSPLEILWYRGLIARSFKESGVMSLPLKIILPPIMLYCGMPIIAMSRLVLPLAFGPNKT